MFTWVPAGADHWQPPRSTGGVAGIRADLYGKGRTGQGARMTPHEIEARLDEAASACARDGLRFTDLRRETLALVLDAAGPIGAYDLLDRLRRTRRNAAPPTVYRALDFLLAQGLIHRVERLNAFIGCVDAGQHAHPVQFLICRGCGAVAELEDPAISQAIDRAASAQGFRPARTTIEVEGTCAACDATQESSQSPASAATSTPATPLT